MKVSVIIPFHRNLNHLRESVSAVRRSMPDAEVLIAADGAVDDCRALAAAAGAQVVVVPGPSGPAVARNRAAAVASGDVLAFVDADVVVAPDALPGMCRLLDMRDRDLDGVFGAYDLSPPERNFMSQYKNLSHAYVHEVGDTHASTFWAGLGAVRADAFRSVGGFDERFRRPSIEDIELGYRLVAAGYSLRLDVTFRGRHLKRWTLRSSIATDIRARGIPWTQLIHRSQALSNDLNTTVAACGCRSCSRPRCVVVAGARALEAMGRDRGGALSRGTHRPQSSVLPVVRPEARRAVRRASDSSASASITSATASRLSLAPRFTGRPMRSDAPRGAPHEVWAPPALPVPGAATAPALNVTPSAAQSSSAPGSPNARPRIVRGRAAGGPRSSARAASPTKAPCSCRATCPAISWTGSFCTIFSARRRVDVRQCDDLRPALLRAVPGALHRTSSAAAAHQPRAVLRDLRGIRLRGTAGHPRVLRAVGRAPLHARRSCLRRRSCRMGVPALREQPDHRVVRAESLLRDAHDRAGARRPERVGAILRLGQIPGLPSLHCPCAWRVLPRDSSRFSCGRPTSRCSPPGADGRAWPGAMSSP